MEGKGEGRSEKYRVGVYYVRREAERMRGSEGISGGWEVAEDETRVQREGAGLVGEHLKALAEY